MLLAGQIMKHAALSRLCEALIASASFDLSICLVHLLVIVRLWRARTRT